MSGLLNTAISGLRVSQAGMRTTGHNISNVNTPGFSRQRTEDVSQPAQQAGGAGYVGSGAATQNIKRIVDQFVLTQLRTDTTNYHSLNSYSANLEKIDKLFADQSTGLTGGLESFFAAIQNAADDPSSTPARQLVVTQAESLSTRFNTLYDRLMDIERNVIREMEAITEQINDLAATVANLNTAIADKSEGGNGHSPNDLLDQRDEALRQLSELVGVNVVSQGDGTVNVFMGQGQALVVGADANRFRVTNAGEVVLGQGSRTRNVTEQLTGGQLSGLAEFRDGILHTAKNELGRVSLVLSGVFNEQQLQGLDLDGDFGERMFKDINSPDLTKQRVVSGNNAAPDDRELSVTIDDINQLTASDYKFEILENTNNYVITRLGDDKVVGQGMLTGAYPESISFDGVTVTLEAGSFQGGDTFTIKPTTDAARYMEARLSRPEDLALASPVRTGTNSGNEGTAEISQGEVLGMFAPDGTLLPAFANAGQLSPPVIIRFTSETTYEILDNSDPSNPKPLEPPIREQLYVPGQDNALFTSDPGETRVVGNGGKLGLPDGRNAQVVAAGGAAQGNGYPVEQMRFRITDPETGVTSTQNVVTGPNMSAANLAEQLGRVPGVSANAFTEATLTDFNFEDFSSPLQITVNGENLLEYQGGALSPEVPNPQTEPAEFQEYLAERINDNPNLQALGFRAEAGANPVTGELEVRMVASSGVDMDIRLQADGAGENQLSVNDSNGNPNVRLSGQGAGTESTVTVGGRVDLTLADGVTLNTAPSDSQLFGDSQAEDFAQSSYLGFQAVIKGQPKAGDTFTLDFNNDASSDNRNGLAMAALETAKVMGNGNMGLSDAYGRLVEQVGTESASARTNTEAARSLVEQTQSMRDSISGVNLDEEAANLIRFEQAYNANSRVITIARDIFDTLLNSI
ncbi:flagellar hook-associated protein FlgK [Marinimicrobium sp. ARAG 43.8]|uniref:flagellar hook-associated protein FlgK n=1 Tax=Marinimicrobium sp. ARAG 43.8 TaxID=3418719 RepID=UPI003CE7E22B